MRHNARAPPLMAPYFVMASIAYAEHVGTKRQLDPPFKADRYR